MMIFVFFNWRQLAHSVIIRTFFAEISLRKQLLPSYIRRSARAQNDYDTIPLPFSKHTADLPVSTKSF